MTLTLASLENVKAERLNHPDDVYVYFNGGYVVWNRDENVALTIIADAGSFYFDPSIERSAHRITIAFNLWVKSCQCK